MDILRTHCKTVGRNYSDIKKSLGLEVVIAETEEEVRQKMIAANSEERKHPDTAYRTPPHELEIEEYKKRRLIGTPEQCISQLVKWLELDVDYVLVGWTMTPRDWRLFAEKVITRFT
jgi:alkanesulfonate monooxygenase SsuD/methylene tetrahydromethanopterin reductase-like flavin-dependent oxidoreductase (luciferase family)